MRTTIRLDDKTLREAKARAAERGIPLNDFIADAVRAALQRREKRIAAVVVPTFPGGALLPGIDLDDSAALLDAMEGQHRYKLPRSRPMRVAEVHKARAAAGKKRRR